MTENGRNQFEFFCRSSYLIRTVNSIIWAENLFIELQYLLHKINA